MTSTRNVEPLIEPGEQDDSDSGIPSTVAIAKHPLHPPLVTFPIAFLVGAFGSDLAFWLTDDLFWATASFWLLATGLASGIIAAITGLLDFLKIDRVRKRQAGWFHAIGNVAVLIATVINFSLRWGNTTDSIIPTGLALSLVVSLLLGITGWYGGELVYRHKIAVIGQSDRQAP
ncbi:DUF2231 domain-containing protein [Merismopedia glauca]|uniref:DUF2231 domain-containing protein n=1 Tax=Merismopedia glauca CCAP 1448/3 TaxID=1296344 RepID=A0A2T1C484_9CYAN|nr:DUF2231 domain-containing protein [Merismopedia glauca]PSB02933.1 hypothetical protein C7B64_10830 [Merismopedia glauca CCAP 1448/3]